jgi:hypothetical protein
MDRSMTSASAASGPWPGRAAPVIAGAALLWLAGCTSSQPVPHYYPAWSGGYGITAPSPSYIPPRYFQPQPEPQSAPSPGGSWLIPRAEAAEPQRPAPPPELHPVDPSCGWWRLCNLWSGS